MGDEGQFKVLPPKITRASVKKPSKFGLPVFFSFIRIYALYARSLDERTDLFTEYAVCPFLTSARMPPI